MAVQLVQDVSFKRISEELGKIQSPLSDVIIGGLKEALHGATRIEVKDIVETLTLINRKLANLITGLTEIETPAANDRFKAQAFADFIAELQSDFYVIADRLSERIPDGHEKLNKIVSGLYSMALMLSSLIENPSTVQGATGSLAVVKDAVSQPDLGSIRQKTTKWVLKNWKSPEGNLRMGVNADKQIAVLYHKYGIAGATFLKSDAAVVLESNGLAGKGLQSKFWSALETRDWIVRAENTRPNCIVYEFTEEAKKFFLAGLTGKV